MLRRWGRRVWMPSEIEAMLSALVNVTSMGAKTLDAV